MQNFIINIKFWKILIEKNKNLFVLQAVRESRNQSITVENLTDDNYMFVDTLQNLTDEYIMAYKNSSFTPEPIWRPFIESVFEGIVKLDLDNRDKLLIGNLDYLKKVALIFAIFKEEILGMYF